MLDPRTSRVIADGIAFLLAKLDGSMDPSIRRVWPGSPDDGTTAGPSLGFLRYLSRTPGVALELKTGTGYWLMLDPKVTAPNAAIGVHLGRSQPGPRSAWQFMVPGDVIYQPGGFDGAWIYSADMLDQIAGAMPAAAARPLGYCGFLVGRTRTSKPPSRAGPLPFARLCAVARLEPAGVGEVIIPSGGLDAISVELRPLDAAGALLPAASWTAYLQMIPIFRGPANTTSLGADGETWDTPGRSGAITVSLTIGAVGGTVVRLPVAGTHHNSLRLVSVSTWTGAAIAFLHAQVEGLP